MTTFWPRILGFYLLMLPALVFAQVDEITAEESPWLVTPTFSSDPKLGNSLGAMAGYLVKFDESSPSSMFGAMASYSDTDSSVYGLFARTYFNADSHRLIAGVMRGKIENEYEDFLGTGFDALTTDDLNINFVRYTKRTGNDWFVGAQIIAMKYDILTDDAETQQILDAVGLTGFRSNGLGLVIERDTRDSQNSPQKGSHISLSPVAFREDLGGDVSFDRYSLKYAKYIGHGSGHVLAGRITGNWTNDAPVSGYSSVNLRGYTRGEYLAPHAVTFEVEERYALGPKLGLTAFLGAACLYGDGASCGDDENWFPAVGAGTTYMLKQKERMIVRAEIAVGKDDNFGFYIQFGNSF